jgi:hypothetical protein
MMQTQSGLPFRFLRLNELLLDELIHIKVSEVKNSVQDPIQMERLIGEEDRVI